MIITIDGPVAAGKTSCARALAARLGAALLDTGAIYRSVALVCAFAEIDWLCEPDVEVVAQRLEIDFRHVAGRNRVIVAGDDVTDAIRKPAISRGASIVSAHPAVRAALLDLQRRFAERTDVVAEGRDTGTVVFPGADHKFYLDAASEVRAQRRYAELCQSGVPGDLDEVREDLRERDLRDASRSVAPLAAAADAIRIDSSQMQLAEVVSTMLQYVTRVPQGTS